MRFLSWKGSFQIWQSIWGLKLEFSEPVGQIGMAVQQCVYKEKLTYGVWESRHLVTDTAHEFGDRMWKI